MTQFERSNLLLLADRVQQLLKMAQALQAENLALKSGTETGTDQNQERFQSLIAENNRLKKENKILKEREKLIKNKIERLAVKLDEIEW